MALFRSSQLQLQWSFSCAVVLTATSALADPPAPSQETIQWRDRTVDYDELVPPVSNETAVKLAMTETKQSAGPDPEKARADVPLTSSQTGPSVGVSVEMITDDPRVTLFRLVDRVDLRARTTGHGVVPVLVLSQQASFECRAPCNRSVDPQFSYHVAGEGITASAPFRFPPDRSTYKLEVDPGSSSLHTAGVILTTAGICLAALGGAFLAVGAVDQEGPAVVPIVGAVGGGVGVISMAVGIPLWISNGTSVRLDATMNESKIRLPAGLALQPPGITF